MSIAIIGMSCLFPDSKDLSSYWKNIITRKTCITDIKETHWRLDDYYDQNISPGFSRENTCALEFQDLGGTFLIKNI